MVVYTGECGMSVVSKIKTSTNVKVYQAVVLIKVLYSFEMIKSPLPRKRLKKEKQSDRNDHRHRPPSISRVPCVVESAQPALDFRATWGHIHRNDNSITTGAFIVDNRRDSQQQQQQQQQQQYEISIFLLIWPCTILKMKVKVVNISPALSARWWMIGQLLILSSNMRVTGIFTIILLGTWECDVLLRSILIFNGVDQMEISASPWNAHVC